MMNYIMYIEIKGQILMVPIYVSLTQNVKFLNSFGSK